MGVEEVGSCAPVASADSDLKGIAFPYRIVNPALGRRTCSRPPESVALVGHTEVTLHAEAKAVCL